MLFTIIKICGVLALLKIIYKTINYFITIISIFFNTNIYYFFEGNPLLKYWMLFDDVPFARYWVSFNEVLVLIFIITCGLLLGLLFPAKVEVFQFINKCLVLLLTLNFVYFNTFFIINAFNKLLNYSSLVHFLILIGGIFIIVFLYIIAGSKLVISNNSNIEFSILVFFSYLSIIFLLIANDFIVSILTLQCLSLVAYILVGFERYNRYSAIAGIKYLLLGSVPGGLFILGVLDLYTVWGSFKEKDLELLYANSSTMFDSVLGLPADALSFINASQTNAYKLAEYNESLFRSIFDEVDDSYFLFVFSFFTLFFECFCCSFSSVSCLEEIGFSYFTFLMENFGVSSINHNIFDDFSYYTNSLIENKNIGIFFLLINLLFKITAAPFHSWAPKIYEGAPIISTIFLSIFTKIAIIFYILHLLFNTFYVLVNDDWGVIFYLSIFGSLLVAIVGASGEKRLKKFFVYSSIGHVAFILLGFLTLSFYGAQASIEYLIIYIITSLIAWIVLLFLAPSNAHLSNLRGLSIANRSLSVALCLSVLSMAGLPPLAGFFVKLNILCSLLDASFKLVVIFVLILTVFNFYYYLRIVKIIFFEPVVENKY